MAHSPADMLDKITVAAMEALMLPVTVVQGVAEANRRMHDYARLDHLTDDALTARQLQRDDVARMVFGDLLGTR